jgi:hypothetical protein
MSRFFRVFLLAVLMVVAVAAPAQAGSASPKTMKPQFSAAPVVGVPFTVSGLVRPQATAQSRTVVSLRLYLSDGGRWRVAQSCRAKLAAGTAATKYTRRLTVPAQGRYAVRVFHYRAGALVAKSAMVSFDVARRIDIDPNVNGWDAPELGDTVAPPDTPLDVVFSRPSDWTSGASEKLNGAAHFIWGDFKQVDTEGLIWHTDGLDPGRYDWMRDSMPKYGTGSLVVAQRIAVDKTSHADTSALPYLPADISFGDVSATGMGCDRSIAFVTRVFSQTSADPLVWHTDGLTPARYDWKCWMDACHYGTLAATSPALQVAIDSDPLDSVTVVPTGTPVDFVFSGARMMCWRTIHFTTAGDFTKTRGYPDPLTWTSGGLAPGSYEWECWMGPQCHHGTIVVQ